MVERRSFKLTNMLCMTVAGCFELSAKRGYNSENFAETVMKSEYGKSIMMSKIYKEYTCSNFMLEGYERYSNIFKGGKVEESGKMWYVGFLYKYWLSTRDLLPDVIYSIAPLPKIINNFQRLHCEGWEYAIDFLCDGKQPNCDVFIPNPLEGLQYK